MSKRIKDIISLIKLFVAYVCSLFLINLRKKEIWLIMEKPIEARDNGYHLFKYLRTEHPEINAYFVISKNSVDLHKVEKYDNIIYHNSFKHFLYYTSALINIGSQPYGASPKRSIFLHKFSCFRRKDQKTIFIQHGIIINELPHSLDYDKTHFNLITATAKREYDFVKRIHGYPDDNIKLLGLCRFDNLYNKENDIKKQILIMPTFRSWLVAKDRTNYATEAELEKFKESDYYKAYYNVLSDKKFIDILEKYGYKVVFYPHYSAQSYIKSFKELENENIIIADRKEYDVQQLLIESSILVTDFSSIFFDFAYMGKPEIFYQFDEEKYRQSHYKKGYFDYKDDGFGPVVYSGNDVIFEIEKILKNDVKISDFYMDRINNFFDLRDDKNCERTYRAIMNLK